MAFYYITVTDTFGGEANYSWKRNYCVEGNHGNAIRRAKAEIGWNGLRCNREDWGETIVLKPRGLNQIAFIEQDPSS
jgi:hypothetical protein